MPTSSQIPIVHPLDVELCDEQISRLFKVFSTLPHAIFMDGNGDTHRTENLNRYSFLMADPIDEVIVTDATDFDWQDLKQKQTLYPTKRVKDLPPFQGGMAGLISYEFNRRIENVPPAAVDEFQIPQLAFFVYDVVLAIDHFQQTAWLISQGWQKRHNTERMHQGKKRLEQFLELIQNSNYKNVESLEFPVPIEIRSPMNRVDSPIELYSDFSKTEFLEMVAKGVDYIHQGDVFQVNLSQRLLTPATKSPVDLYLDMRSANPAPFSGYMDFGNGQLVSASPERLVSVRNEEVGDRSTTVQIVETRPIKGTRKRTHYPEVDLNIREQLLNSDKDRAENIMIVDLMRNDLSKIARPASVVVKKLCGIEQFQNVLHLVSVVQGELLESKSSIDVLKSTFPGGSITGAPKIRAMEIIAELEPTARGPYCGSFGYISPDGQMDFSILIRSVTAKDGWWQIPVGGGIVSDSVPEMEYDETWTKAIGMLQAISRKTKTNIRRPHQQHQELPATSK